MRLTFVNHETLARHVVTCASIVVTPRGEVHYLDSGGALVGWATGYTGIFWAGPSWYHSLTVEIV